ncbi:TPA: Gfo/Idh/MocA family oxidoreductase, partial [bacterium]|nr:Gfo/Idh/MocA family oxidoreductase [bacterium]
MKKIKIGVIGAGSFASRRHIPVIVKSSDAELVALCRRDREMLQKMAEHFNCDYTFTDYRDMLDSVEMDAVLIATPHALHFENTMLALEKGLHVLVEKEGAMSGLGEYLRRAGRGYESLVMVTLGSGVGGGVVLEG